MRALGRAVLVGAGLVGAGGFLAATGAEAAPLATMQYAIGSFTQTLQFQG